eukprot:5259036-Amphidinium_carterae.1
MILSALLLRPPLYVPKGMQTVFHFEVLLQDGVFLRNLEAKKNHTQGSGLAEPTQNNAEM